MKQALKILINISFFLFFYSCGQSGETTKAKLVFDTSFLAVSNSLGGVYFFGKNKDTNEDFAFTDNSIPTELELSNGNWTFLAAAWDGNTDPLKKMEGTIKCSKVDSNLTGSEISIHMSLTTDNCKNLAFGRPEHRNLNGDLLPLKFWKCGDGFDNCANSTPQSFKIVLKQKNLNGQIINGLTSRCIADTTVATPLIEGAYDIKGFSNQIPTEYKKIEIHYFSDNTCTNKNYTFVPDSLSIDPKLRNWNTFNNSTFVDYRSLVPICETAQGQGATPHSAGTEKIICNKEQFVYMNSNPSLNYKFLSDINLGGDTYSTSLVSSALLGNVDGSGHKIFNGILVGSTNNIGIFYSFGGNGVTVKNLKVEGITLISPTTAGLPSGALVASISNGVTLENITAENITITANGSSKVGAIAGWYNYTGSNLKIENIGSVKNITISAQTQCTNIGGAFGMLTSTSPSHFSEINATDVTIDLASCTAASTLEVGGVIGSLSINEAISNIVANRIKIKMSTLGGTLNSVGGIIGKEYSPSSNRKIKNIYISNSEIGTAAYPLRNTSKVGGIIGSSNELYGIIGNTLAKSVNIYVTPTAGPPSSIGGIIGRGLIQVSDALFSGNINAPGVIEVGGIIGTKEAQAIISSKSFGSINCESVCGAIVGKQITPGGSLTRLYSAMNIASTLLGGTAGGIIGHAFETAIDEVAFEGVLTGKDYLGGIVGTLQLNNPGTYNLVNLYTNAMITDIDSGDSVALGVGNVNGALLTNLDIQKAYFLGRRNNSTLINNAIKINSGSSTIVNNPSNCINGNADGPTAIGNYSIKSDMTNSSGTFLTSSPPQWALNTTTSLYELDFVYNLRKLDALSRHASAFDPILINTPAKWNLISDNPNFMNKTFLLTSNLDFESIAFNPIGGETNFFTGAFLGNGKSIKNISFSSQSAINYVGVFGSIGPGARINDEKSILPELLSSNNLIISNSYFESDDGQSIGTFAGKINDATNPIVIKNITIFGDESLGTSEINTNAATTVNIGGAIGLAQLYESASIVENIKVKDFNINADSADSSSIGGVIGSFDGGNANFSKLFFSGTIDGSNMASAGGIFGYLNQTGATVLLNQLASTGEITTSATPNIGGLYGLKGTGTVNIASAKVNMILTGDNIVGCLGGNYLAGLSLGHIYAICPTLNGAATYGLLQSGFTNNGKTLFNHGSTIDTNNFATTVLSDFTSYTRISSIIGEAPWPEFIYESGKYPYLPFENEI